MKTITFTIMLSVQLGDVYMINLSSSVLQPVSSGLQPVKTLIKNT